MTSRQLTDVMHGCLLDGVKRVGHLQSSRKFPQRCELLVDGCRDAERSEHAPGEELGVAAIAAIHKVEEGAQQQHHHQHAEHGRESQGEAVL